MFFSESFIFVEARSVLCSLLSIVLFKNLRRGR